MDNLPQASKLIPNNEGSGHPSLGLLNNVDEERDALRVASLLGYVPYGSKTPGGVRKLEGYIQECVAAYDVETSLEDERLGGFPLPDSKILSACAMCTCGESLMAYHKDGNPSNSLFDWVMSHKPRWLIGWNNYLYDNRTLLYHSDKWRDVSVVERVSVAGNVGYGIRFDILGVYNIDAYVYVCKSRPSQFDSFSLSVIAASLGVAPKMNMPAMGSEVPKDVLLEYNLNDCRVTVEVWRKLNLDKELVSLCLCASCSPYDACRYVTGTMMACLLSSRVVQRGMRIMWDPCPRRYDFEGGYVMEPVSGIHRDVFVCDFNSMYPSVIIGCNISPEIIEIVDLGSDSVKDEVKWDSEYVYITLSDCIAKFKYKGEDGMLRNVLVDMVRERVRYKKSDPFYATSLKVCSNSLYGAIGFENSSLYSPRCAAAVTAASRWSLRQAKKAFKEEGLEVVGGDTDSCFVRPVGEDVGRTESERRVNEALRKLSSRMKNGPLEGLRMEKEDYFSAVILLRKKRYCKLREDGSMKFTGLTFAKKSESEMRRMVCKETCEAVLQSRSEVEACNLVKDIFDKYSRLIMIGKCEVKFLAGLLSKDGLKRYTYKRKDGKQVSLLPDEADNVIDDYDPKPYLQVLNKEISSITNPAGLGTLRDCLKRASTL